MEALDKDMRRTLRLAKANAARSGDLDEKLAELVNRLDAVWKETPPRPGRPKLDIREETRRRVRGELARNPKAGWRAIAGPPGFPSGWRSVCCARSVEESSSRGRKPFRQAGRLTSLRLLDSARRTERSSPDGQRIRGAAARSRDEQSRRRGGRGREARPGPNSGSPRRTSTGSAATSARTATGPFGETKIVYCFIDHPDPSTRFFLEWKTRLGRAMDDARPRKGDIALVKRGRDKDVGQANPMHRYVVRAAAVLRAAARRARPRDRCRGGRRYSVRAGDLVNSDADREALLERFGRFCGRSASRSCSAQRTTQTAPHRPSKKVTTQRLAANPAARRPRAGRRDRQDAQHEAEPGDRAASVQPGGPRVRHAGGSRPRSRRSGCRRHSPSAARSRTGATTTSARPPSSRRPPVRLLPVRVGHSARPTPSAT